MKALRKIGVDHQTIDVKGSRYVVTLDTGEIHYGSRGSTAFAYDAEDFTGRDNFADYADFCDRFEPIGSSDPNWIAVAVAAAIRGWRLTEAGACVPALTDREYELTRLASDETL